MKTDIRRMCLKKLALAAVLLLSNVMAIAYAGTRYPIHAGLNGFWQLDGVPGQAVLINITPDSRLMSLGLLSYVHLPTDHATASSQRWLTAVGNYRNGQAELVLLRTEGGTFLGVTPVSNTEVGEATLTFSSCSEGTMALSIDNRQYTVRLLKLVGSIACVALERPLSVPTFYRLQGRASSVDEQGRETLCEFSFITELVEEPAATDEERRWVGRGGGHANRYVADASGGGLSFFLDLFFERVTVTRSRTHESALRIAVDFPSQDVELSAALDPFQREILDLAGSVDARGRTTGPWTCAPLDTLTDVEQRADGAWYMEPIIAGANGGDANRAVAKLDALSVRSRDGTLSVAVKRTEPTPQP